MTIQLTTFNFHTLDVRVIEQEGEPWFVAADVVRVLAFKTPQMVYARLEPEHKATVSRTDVGMRPGKPVAREFKQWVTGTVLPAIRKDGAYIMGEEKVATGEMTEDEMILKTFTILQAKVERLTSERDLAVQKVGLLTL